MITNQNKAEVFANLFFSIRQNEETESGFPEIPHYSTPDKGKQCTRSIFSAPTKPINEAPGDDIVAAK